MIQTVIGLHRYGYERSREKAVALGETLQRIYGKNFSITPLHARIEFKGGHIDSIQGKVCRTHSKSSYLSRVIFFYLHRIGPPHDILYSYHTDIEPCGFKNQR